MRNMSVEYLRVVFISFIVLLHILWKNYGGLYIQSNIHTSCAYIQLGLTNMVSLGVTGFILISGYYGVKLKLNRLISLWIQTTSYSLISAVLIYLMCGGSPIKKIVDAPLSLFDGGWWFISDYVILLLLSPFLNYGLERINKNSLLFIIAMLSFIMYGVWWFHARDASMPLLLFFNTYLVGRYLRLYPIKCFEKYKYIIFIVGLIAIVAEPMILHFIGLHSKMKFVGGNFNILVLVVDIALLLICIEHHKMGKGNMLTKNVLAVYLIHESGFGRKILHEVIFHEGLKFNIVYILCFVVSVVVVCTVVEEVRKWLFNNLESCVIHKIDSLLKLYF